MPFLRKDSFGEYIAIFLAGAAWDSLASLDTVFTSHFNLGGLFMTSVFINLMGYAVLERTLEGAKVNWSKVWTLSLGSGCGAVLATWGAKLLY